MSRRQRRAISKRYRRDPDTVLILGDLDPLPIETREITDPYARSEEVFEASYARIDRCVDSLTAVLTNPLSSATASLARSPVA